MTLNHKVVFHRELTASWQQENGWMAVFVRLGRHVDLRRSPRISRNCLPLATRREVPPPRPCGGPRDAPPTTPRVGQVLTLGYQATVPSAPIRIGERRAQYPLRRWRSCYL